MTRSPKYLLAISTSLAAVVLFARYSYPALAGEDEPVEDVGWSVECEPWIVDMAEVTVNLDGDEPLEPSGIGALIFKPAGRAAEVLTAHGVEFREGPRGYTNIIIGLDDASRPTLRSGGATYWHIPARDNGYYFDCHTTLIDETGEVHVTMYYYRDSVCLHFDVLVTVEMPDISEFGEDGWLTPEQLAQSQITWTYQGECEWPEPQEHGE